MLGGVPGSLSQATWEELRGEPEAWERALAEAGPAAGGGGPGPGSGSGGAAGLGRGLRELDVWARCGICQEFLDGAVTVQCGHAFCAECLRGNLTFREANKPGAATVCPQCREPTTAQHIRPATTLQGLVTAFKDARGPLLELLKLGGGAAAANGAAGPGPSGARGPKKRGRGRRAEPPLAPAEGVGPTAAPKVEVVQVSSSGEDSDEDFVPTARTAPGRRTPGKGKGALADRRQGKRDSKGGTEACPICGVMVSMALLQQHVNVCIDKQQQQRPHFYDSFFSKPKAASRAPATRVATLHYHGLKDKQLKAHLEKLHPVLLQSLPTKGGKDEKTRALVSRHKEYRKIFNAALDAGQPKSPRDVAQQVLKAERDLHMASRRQLQATATKSTQKKKEEEDRRFAEMIKEVKERERRQKAQAEAAAEPESAPEPEPAEEGGSADRDPALKELGINILEGTLMNSFEPEDPAPALPPAGPSLKRPPGGRLRPAREEGGPRACPLCGGPSPHCGCNPADVRHLASMDSDDDFIPAERKRRRGGGRRGPERSRRGAACSSQPEPF